MLPKDNRLKADKDYERIKKEGKVVQSTSFGLAVVDRKDEKPSRFGFIVSAKVSPNASGRNKAKRALREAVRQNLVFIKSGFDIVFLGKAGIDRKYTSDLMIEVKTSFKASKLLKE